MKEGTRGFSPIVAPFFWSSVAVWSQLAEDTPYVSGKVQTQSGIVVLAATLTLKGVMWIVPGIWQRKDFGVPVRTSIVEL